jgi:hypothetical protein
VVQPTGTLSTSESGGTASFQVSLSRAPLQDVADPSCDQLQTPAVAVQNLDDDVAATPTLFTASDGALKFGGRQGMESGMHVLPFDQQSAALRATLSGSSDAAPPVSLADPLELWNAAPATLI